MFLVLKSLTLPWSLEYYLQMIFGCVWLGAELNTACQWSSHPWPKAIGWWWRRKVFLICVSWQWAQNEWEETPGWKCIQYRFVLIYLKQSCTLTTKNGQTWHNMKSSPCICATAHSEWTADGYNDFLKTLKQTDEWMNGVSLYLLNIIQSYRCCLSEGFNVNSISRVI